MMDTSGNASVSQRPDIFAAAAASGRGSILPRLVGSIALTPDEAVELHEMLRRRPSFVPPARPSPNIFADFAASARPSDGNPATAAEANMDQLVDDLLNSRSYFTLSNLEAKEATARNTLMSQFIAVATEIRNAKGEIKNISSDLLDSVGPPRRLREVSALPVPRRKVLVARGAAYLVREIVIMTELINTERFQLSEAGCRYFQYEDVLAAELQLAVDIMKLTTKKIKNSNATATTSHAKKIHEPNIAELEEEVARTDMDAEESQQRGGLRLVMKMSAPAALIARAIEVKKFQDQESDDEKDRNNLPQQGDDGDEAAALKIQSAQRQRAARQELDRLKNEQKAHDQKSDSRDNLNKEREPTTVELEEELDRGNVDEEEGQARGGLRLVWKMAVKQPQNYQSRPERAHDAKSSDDDEVPEQQQQQQPEQQHAAPSSVLAASTLSEDAAAVKIQSAQRQRLARQELDRRRSNNNNNKAASSLPAAPTEQFEEPDEGNKNKIARSASYIARSRPPQKNGQQDANITEEVDDQTRRNNLHHENNNNNEHHNSEKNKPKELENKKQGHAPTEQVEEVREISPEQAAAHHSKKQKEEQDLHHHHRGVDHEDKTKEQEDAEYQAMLKQEERNEIAAPHHHHDHQQPQAQDGHNHDEHTKTKPHDETQALSYEEIQALATEHVRRNEEERRREEEKAAESRRQEQLKKAAAQEEKQKRADEEAKTRRIREAEEQLNQLAREDRAARQQQNQEQSSPHSRSIEVSPAKSVAEATRNDAGEQDERRRFLEYQQEKKQRQEEEERQQAEQERANYDKLKKLDALDFNPFAEVHEEKRKRKLALAEQKKQEEEEHKKQQQQKSRAITLIPSPPRHSANLEDDEDEASNKIEPRQLSSALSPRPNRVLRREKILPKNDPKSAASVLARIFERETNPALSLNKRGTLDKPENYEEVNVSDIGRDFNDGDEVKGRNIIHNHGSSPSPPHRQNNNVISNRLKHLPLPPADTANDNPRNNNNGGTTTSTNQDDDESTNKHRSCFDVSSTERERLNKLRQ